MIPPPLPEEVRDRLIQAYGRIALFSQRVEREHGDEIVCGRGCDGCCRQVLRLRGVEAAYLLEGARKLSPPAVSLVWSRLPAAEGEDPCPLLHGGTCVLYEHRPAVCRTHGLAMLRREGDQAFVHHCPENFQNTDPSRFDPSLLLDEERLVLLMDAVDALFCRASGWKGGRVPVSELLRSGLQA